MISDVDLEREFGVPFLAYVSARDEVTIRERLHTGALLDGPAEAVLERLRALAATPTPVSSGWGPTGWLVKEALRESRGGQTEFQELRTACGGSVDVPTSPDSLTNILLRITLDVYPLLLVPRGEQAYPGPWGLPAQLYLHEAVRDHRDATTFETAALADVDLRRLFPRNDPANGRCGTIVPSTGGSRDIFLKFLSSAIIELTWWEQRLGLGKAPTPEELYAHVPVATDKLRALARGESIQVNARVGFNGAALHRQTPIATTLGTLRAETDADAWYIPGPARRPALEPPPMLAGLPATPSFLEAFGDKPFFLDPSTAQDYATPVLFVTTLDMTLSVDGQQQASSLETNCKILLGAAVETVQLGILTAIRNQPQPLVVAPSWWMIALPFMGLQYQWNELFASWLLSHMPRAVTLSYYAAVRDAIDRVAALRTPFIDVAIRRLLSAHIERETPADRLIDIVIAWENLFGPRSQTEITKTISKAVGNLLSDGSSKAADQIRKDAARIYGVRSRLVHGGSARAGQLERSVPRAFDLTRQAFCELLERRPELLTDPMRGERLRGPDSRWPWWLRGLLARVPVARRLAR
jgi:Apea-like HEPN